MFIVGALFFGLICSEDNLTRLVPTHIIKLVTSMKRMSKEAVQLTIFSNMTSMKKHAETAHASVNQISSNYDDRPLPLKEKLKPYMTAEFDIELLMV